MIMLLLKKYAQNNRGSIPGTPNKIFSKWENLKKRFACYLQQQSESLSVNSKKISLALFCFLFGGTSTYIIIHSVSIKEKTVSVQNISRLPRPYPNEEIGIQPDSIITKMEYERIQQFKNYLIHLRDDSTGRTKFDSIMIARPRLLDSIRIIEKMYLSQK